MERIIKTQAMLIDILGEETFNACRANPQKATTLGWLLSFAAADFDQSQGIDSVISSTLLKVKDELGEEFCVWCSRNHDKLLNLTALLDSYVTLYESTQKNKEKIRHLFQTINSNNFKARAVSVLAAFNTNQRTNLIELFRRAKINYICDLQKLLSLNSDDKEVLELEKFMAWLNADIMMILKNELQLLLNNYRTKKIMEGRAQGATLMEISLNLGITRQRVRQIEKNFQHHFNSYVLKFKPQHIIYAFTENTNYITANNINECFGNLSEIVTYCLKESDCTSLQWCLELNAFILGDGRWYTQLKAYKNKLPEILDYHSVDPLIRRIRHILSLPIGNNETREIILSGYCLTGNVYLKNKISLSKMYHAVLERFYPNGIELYNATEANSFRNHVRRLFGDVYLPKNNRALDVRLANFTILCGKRKRILPSGAKVSMDLLDKIHEAITTSEKSEIPFKELFEQFKNELLENSNISNSYFLQGFLRFTYSEEFDFTRYSLRKRHSPKD